MTAYDRAVRVERISIELSRRCTKACAFCYNGSGPRGDDSWTPGEVVGLVADCARHGVRAASFGGGEPLEYDGLVDVLRALEGHVFRSVTTNGLLLDRLGDALAGARPDKVHVSIHFPADAAEVARVVRQVGELAARGVKSGCNLLVRRSQLEAAAGAARALHAAGIANDRIVYLPMRGADTPTPAEMASVAGAAGTRFQSVSCLAACGRSERFASLSADKAAAWCSYTVARRRLPELTHSGLERALADLDLTFCGGTDGRPSRLPRGPQHGHDVVRGGP